MVCVSKHWPLVYCEHKPSSGACNAPYDLSVLFSFAGRLGGYRSMRHLLVRKHHMHVPHSVVRLILRQMDPVGVVARQHHRLHRRTYFSHGPNDVWHVDGNDKLRLYGILISGVCARTLCSITSYLL